MLIFFDSETSGLVQFSLPHDHPAQPHLVQLGCILTEDDGRTVQTIDLIVKPEGYSIPDAAAAVHGITTEIAERVGLPLILVISAFTHLRAKANTIVAHNLPFDERIMATAIHRTGKVCTLQTPLNRACTLEMAEPILKLPATAKMVAAGRANQFKKPSLKECYQHFFSEELRGAHTALADAQACARIYFAMKNLAVTGGARTMNIKTFQILRKLMQQTTSDNDHEALAALRKANALLREDNVTWDKFFSRTVQVINDFDAADDEPNSEGKRRAKMVDQAFEVLARKELRGDAEDFIASLQEQWTNNGHLSEKQTEALFKFARNAEEGRR